MGLDVRLPIGLLFAAIGLALCAFGALSDPSLYQKSRGINVNLLWGAVLLVFGCTMLVLGWRPPRHHTAPPASREHTLDG